MTDADEASALFHALGHPYRRVACYYLDEHDEGSLSTLADCVTGWLESGPGAGAPAPDRDEVRVRLHQVHLPTLAGAGLVAYDRGERVAALEPLSEATAALLADARRADVEGGILRKRPASAERAGDAVREDEDG